MNIKQYNCLYLKTMRLIHSSDCRYDVDRHSRKHKTGSNGATNQHGTSNGSIIMPYYYNGIQICIVILVLSHLAIIQSLADAVNHVTCGSVVKLSNVSKPKIRLHSHDIKYGSGSGQQSVTGAENQDTNSYWSLLGTKNHVCNRGGPIECGATIRLQHVQTRKFLHSHLFKSPLSSQQEVSAFGSDDESDTGDYWKVYCKTKNWQKGDTIQLKHVDTNTWLSLSGNTYGRPIYGQAEIICSTSSDSSSHWKVAEGVYVQPTTKEDIEPLEHDEL